MGIPRFDMAYHISFFRIIIFFNKAIVDRKFRFVIRVIARTIGHIIPIKTKAFFEIPFFHPTIDIEIFPV